MNDREKVLEGLESCAKSDPENWCYHMCELCPYGLTVGCKHILAADALELLKEQEPVEPIEERLNDIDCIYRCGNCKTHFYYRQQKYCAICGRMAKWK